MPPFGSHSLGFLLQGADPVGGMSPQTLMGVVGQGVMVLSQRRVDLDEIKGRFLQQAHVVGRGGGCTFPGIIQGQAGGSQI